MSTLFQLFLPDLFRIAIVRAAGTAPVGPTLWSGSLPPLQQLWGPLLLAVASVGRHLVSLLAPWEAAGKSLITSCCWARERPWCLALCVYCVYLMNLSSNYVHCVCFGELRFKLIAWPFYITSWDPWALEACMSYTWPENRYGMSNLEAVICSI